MKTGVVVWITGLPSSGKSTFASRLSLALRERGLAACLLDGDSVRDCLVPRPGYSAAERARFYETLARLAALVASQGFAVLVPATANRREYRRHARELAPAFVEVWIDTGIDECRTRDTKGLYRASAEGRVTGVPGAGDDYETPETPDVVGRGGMDDAAVARVVEVIETRSPKDRGFAG